LEFLEVKTAVYWSNAVWLLYVFASVTDKKGLGQSACPKEWKKYEGGMDSNINVM
jgi:hypothetical protein